MSSVTKSTNYAHCTIRLFTRTAHAECSGDTEMLVSLHLSDAVKDQPQLSLGIMED